MEEWWNIKENCQLKSFTFGLIVGVALVLFIAWDKIVCIC